MNLLFDVRQNEQTFGPEFRRRFFLNLQAEFDQSIAVILAQKTPLMGLEQLLSLLIHLRFALEVLARDW